MRISIVTPSFNQGEFVEQTIRSVMEQDYSDVEHIVVDGGSTDRTLSVLSRYPHLKWKSEKDTGQSNAINKGFQRSTGQILAWINSDDYYETNIFRVLVEYFESHPDCMFLYGDITYVGKDGTFLKRTSGDVMNYENLVRSPDIVRQPSCFWRRALLDEIGGIDESLHIVMDFDFFLRAAKHYKFHYLSKNLSFYRSYAENKTGTARIRQTYEIYKIFRKRGIGLNPVRVRYLLVKLLDSIGVGDILRRLIRTFTLGQA